MAKKCNDEYHAKNRKGECLTCEYWRQMSEWEASPDWVAENPR